MYQKENSSWVKHADFTICDMLCLQLAFVLAYWIRNGIDQPYDTALSRMADHLCTLYLLQLLRQTGIEEIPEGSQIRRKREAIPADRYSQ